MLKIYRPDRNCFERERYALEFAASCSRFATPEIVLTGNHNGLDYLFVTKIHGNEITRQEFLALGRGDQIDILSELAIGLTELHEAPVGFDPDWREFVEERAATFIERQIERRVNLKIIDRRRLMMLTMLYETSDLRRYALRLRPDAVYPDVYELEKAIWAFV